MDECYFEVYIFISYIERSTTLWRHEIFSMMHPPGMNNKFNKLEMFVGYLIEAITKVKISVQWIFLASVQIYNVDYSIAFAFIMNRHFIPHSSFNNST